MFSWYLNQFNKLALYNYYLPCPVLEVGCIMVSALLQTRNVQSSIVESVISQQIYYTKCSVIWKGQMSAVEKAYT